MSAESQDWKAAPAQVGDRDPRADLLREYHSLATGVAGVLDDVEHLLTEASDTEANRLALLRRKLAQVLLFHGVRPTARQGQPLDLHFHEVIGTEARQDVPADTITTVVKPGYELMMPGFEPMLLRCAKVIVSTAPEADKSEGDTMRHGVPEAPKGKEHKP